MTVIPRSMSLYQRCGIKLNCGMNDIELANVMNKINDRMTYEEGRYFDKGWLCGFCVGIVASIVAFTIVLMISSI